MKKCKALVWYSKLNLLKINNITIIMTNKKDEEEGKKKKEKKKKGKNTEKSHFQINQNTKGINL